MGTGPFAVPSFDALRMCGGHEILLVVTRPIQNSDAKSKSIANPVRDWADAHGLLVIDPPSINDESAIDQITRLQADLLVVCDYGQILSKSAIKSAKLGGINLHGSLLPRHRGAAPVQWSILRGDTVTGACVIHMTPKLDGGPIIASVETLIGKCENAGDLERRLSELGIQSCLDSVTRLAQFSSLDQCVDFGTPQDSSLATPAPRLSKSDGQLDFRYPGQLIDRQARGLQPWPGVYGNIKIGESKEIRVIVGQLQWSANMASLLEKADQSSHTSRKSEKFAVGEILWGARLRELLNTSTLTDQKVFAPMMVVVCADGFLEIVRLQPAGKKMQDAKEFLSGYGKADSMRFDSFGDGPPHSLLEKMRVSTRLSP